MSCKTTNIVDPRIEPQPEPVYSRIVGPRQNQFYKLAPSSISNSSITFNNMTTLGVDRAYLDTFELEVTAQITFENDFVSDATKSHAYAPLPSEWTFDSFPFAKCCEQVRVNLNGGAFFSSPLAYVRAKERYWCEKQLSECYENLCPIHKPHLQNEVGVNMGDTTAVHTTDTLLSTISDFTCSTNVTNATVRNSTGDGTTSVVGAVDVAFDVGSAAPTRLPIAQKYYMQTPAGLSGTNNSIIHLGKSRASEEGMVAGIDYENYYWPREQVGTNDGQPVYRKGHKLVVTVTWREPIFCSPFSSRIDATYGRPLYNVTSMDIQFNMCPNLGNMIRLAHIYNSGSVTNYKVDIKNCMLCYQVMTIPVSVVKPPSTLVPYRRFVPYITDIPRGTNYAPGDVVKIRSGVYTWNEIPQAVWIFLAPSKSIIETNEADKIGATSNANNLMADHTWCSNKAFAYLNQVDITLANTTQILSTASREDLYRIAKANGCCDSYEAWTVPDALNQRVYSSSTADGITSYQVKPKPQGIGSVLRLIPGIDIILPDQDLIPAANANNMVLQVYAEFTMPEVRAQQYSLWLLFEYNGVASFTPGQCEITMNPLGSGEVFAVSPTISATGEGVDGKLEGSGWFGDLINRVKAKWRHFKDSGAYKPLMDFATGGLNNIDHPAAKAAAQYLGSVQPEAKKAKTESSGGAVLGLGDFI